MARHSHRHRVPAVAPGALRHARSLQHKTKTPYRVVYEQVTEKKKKLIKEVSLQNEMFPSLESLTQHLAPGCIQSKGPSGLYIHSSRRSADY